MSSGRSTPTALSLAALLLPTGVARRRLRSAARVFALGLGVSSRSARCCAASPQSSLMLILCRALQGIGGADDLRHLAGAHRAARSTVKRARRPRSGSGARVAGIATAVGPLLGGALTTWPELALDLLRQHPDRRDRDRDHVDPRVDGVQVRRTRAGSTSPASSSSRVGLVALVYGLIESSLRRLGRRPRWSSASLIAVVVLLVDRSRSIEMRFTPQPMFDLRLFRKPTFVGGSIAAFGMNASLYSMLLYFVLYLQNGRPLLGAADRTAPGRDHRRLAG